MKNYIVHQIREFYYIWNCYFTLCFLWFTLPKNLLSFCVWDNLETFESKIIFPFSLNFSKEFVFFSPIILRREIKWYYNDSIVKIGDKKKRGKETRRVRLIRVRLELRLEKFIALKLLRINKFCKLWLDPFLRILQF